MSPTVKCGNCGVLCYGYEDLLYHRQSHYDGAEDESDRDTDYEEVPEAPKW